MTLSLSVGEFFIRLLLRGAMPVPGKLLLRSGDLGSIHMDATEPAEHRNLPCIAGKPLGVCSGRGTTAMQTTPRFSPALEPERSRGIPKLGLPASRGNPERTEDFLQILTESLLVPLSRLTHIELRAVDARQSFVLPPASETDLCTWTQCLGDSVPRCTSFHVRLRDRAFRGETAIAICPAGYGNVCFPLNHGGENWGCIEASRFYLSEPANLEEIQRQFVRRGLNLPAHALEAIDKSTPRINDAALEGMVAVLRFTAGYILREHIAASSASFESEPQALIEARKFIANHLVEKFGVVDVARAAGLSEDYFTRLFRQKTGMTVQSFVARQRIERAKLILRFSNRRISEVAFDCGFETISHFTRVFRKLAGMPPARWRTQNQAGN